MISRGEFDTIGLERILKMLTKHEARRRSSSRATRPGRGPTSSSSIVDQGHEIGHHGWVHENPATLDIEAEREMMERGFEAFDFAVGERPIGYRSAAWDFSPNTIELLLEYGFTYSLELYGERLLPLLPAEGRRMVREVSPIGSASSPNSSNSAELAPGRLSALRVRLARQHGPDVAIGCPRDLAGRVRLHGRRTARAASTTLPATRSSSDADTASRC